MRLAHARNFTLALSLSLAALTTGAPRPAAALELCEPVFPAFCRTCNATPLSLFKTCMRFDCVDQNGNASTKVSCSACSTTCNA